MKCFWHKWTGWGKPFNSEEVRTRGSFGKTSTDDVVVQEKYCVKCGLVKSQVVREGRVSDEGSDQ